MYLYSKLNQELVEEFGRLEQLCNQIYGENHGVTRYIEDMDNLPSSARYKVDGWDYYYKTLKLVRHKRNNLSHGEVLFNEKYAEPEDIQFISDFYKLILNSKDPISLCKKHTNGGCLSEFKSFFIIGVVAALILLILYFLFTAYFK